MVEFRRFFAQMSDRIGDTVCLYGEEHKHLSKVLRMNSGDNVVVCFDDGIDVKCQINAVEKDRTVLTVVDSYRNESELPVRITLFQAVVKGDRMDMILQKAVELGAYEIVPFDSRYAVAKSFGKEERFNRITAEAAKQCGRAVRVRVHDTLRFSEVLDKLTDYDLALFCNEREYANGFKSAFAETDAQSIAIVVGAEGGFSEDEEEKLCRVAKSVSLGKRILRAETAAIYALSVAASRYEV